MVAKWLHSMLSLNFTRIFCFIPECIAYLKGVSTLSDRGWKTFFNDIDFPPLLPLPYP